MKGELTPILLIVATGSLVLAVVLTAVGLQLQGEDLLLELAPTNDPASNGQILVAPAGAPASCTSTSDEWKVDVSVGDSPSVIKRIDAFMRFAPGPPPPDNTISAILEGGLVSTDASPNSPFLTSATVTTTHGDGVWVEFDVPDYDLNGNLIAVMIRAQPGHETSGWDAAASSQGSMRGACAGTSDTTWNLMPTQMAVRIYGTFHGGTSTDGDDGGGPDLSRISPFFFGLSWALYVAALMPTKALGLKIIEAIAAGVGGYIVWAYVADGVQRALGG